MKRAVITGIGIVSSIGSNKNEVLYSLKSGISGISFSKEMKNIGMRSHVWGSIKLNTQNLINNRIIRFMNEASTYAYFSMQEAIQDACLTSDIYQKNDRVGVIVGSSGGSPKNHFFSVNSMRNKRGLKSIGPYAAIKSMTSNLSACLSTFFKIYGISYSISAACASSSYCIGNAVELIKSGKQDIIFAGGSEELTWELACGFDAMGALSTRYNNTPTLSSRVYDIDRDGFVISAGSGILVIEELTHALSRHAFIYAEIIGYGFSSDGNDMILPTGQGAIRSMQSALEQANTAIDCINVHGTSTKIGDIKELDAIIEVYGKNNVPLISATKSMTGHSLGASGVHEIIYSTLMLQHDFISPSINIISLDPNVKNINIVTYTLFKKINTIMSNNFGFGGTNVTLIIKKFKL